VERELVMTGIGGQGIQLAAQVLARAAIAEGTQVQLFGSYGGMMRGGKTEATLVFADGPVESPPTVGHAWSGIVMHPEHASDVVPRVVEGGLLLVNSSICGELAGGRPGVRRIELPATDLAVDAGNIMTASMVMAGAFAELSGIVSVDAVSAAISSALPSYRTQHIALNERAVEIGCAAAADVAARAGAS
jgi:Pyruvate/2-oxoacid:ferredoxin oxidoreductase gamma subunit